MRCFRLIRILLVLRARLVVIRLNNDEPPETLSSRVAPRLLVAETRTVEKEL